MTRTPARTWPSRLMSFLASGRLAVILLAVLVLLYLLYLWIPQWDPDLRFAEGVWIGEHGAPGWFLMVTGLTDIQHSLWLRTVYALLLINLTLCMARRVRPALALMRFPARPPAPRPDWIRREIPAVGDALQAAARALRRGGFRTLAADGAVYGLRGRFAVAGHWVFHVSLLALLVLGIYLASTPDTFRGVLGIGEGESFRLDTAPFLATNDIPVEGLPPLSFTVDQVEAAASEGEVRRFEVTISGPGMNPVRVGLNHPYRERPYQVTANGFGFMPGWAVVDASGRMVGGAWVKLMPYPRSEEESFPIGPEGHTVSVRFFPDHRAHGSLHRTASWEPRNPRFLARIQVQEETLFEGLLEPGQTVPLGNGLSFLFLPEIRRFAMLEVRQEKGHIAVFTMLGLMVLGLGIRYARTRKEILVKLNGSGMLVQGHSEMLPSLFEEEMDRLMESLQHPSAVAAGREVLA